MNFDNGTEQRERGEGEGMLSPARPAHMQKKNKTLLRLVGLGIMLTGGVAVILTMLLLVFPLFRADRIEVVGNSHYSAEEIIEMAGLEEGMEVFAVDAQKTAHALLEASPYMESCKISVYPFSVKIEITEKRYVMYTEYDRGYVSFEYLSDNTMLVLEASEVCDEMEDFPHATLPAISSATVGGRIAFVQKTLDTTYMWDVIDVLEEYEVYESVASIDFSSRTNLYFELENGCRIKLGSARELDDKIVEALNQLNNNKNVVEIDVSDLKKPTIKTH